MDSRAGTAVVTTNFMTYSLIAMDDRIAKKQHDCIWCPEKIQIGEKYKDERSNYGGEFQHHHWHPECHEAFLALFHETGEDEIYPHESKRGSSEHADAAMRSLEATLEQRQGGGE